MCVLCEEIWKKKKKPLVLLPSLSLPIFIQIHFSQVFGHIFFIIFFLGNCNRHSYIAELNRQYSAFVWHALLAQFVIVGFSALSNSLIFFSLEFIKVSFLTWILFLSQYFNVGIFWASIFCLHEMHLKFVLFHLSHDFSCSYMSVTPKLHIQNSRLNIQLFTPDAY